MSALNTLLQRLQGDEIERTLGLKPPYPGLAIGIDSQRLALARVKGRGGNAVLEAVAECEGAAGCVPATLFEQTRIDAEALKGSVERLLQQSGTKPGKASVILPDNLAKISLLSLPERPASNKQLEQIVRSQMRRAVPFRLEEAQLSFQMLPAPDGKVAVLVVLVRKGLLEQIETVLAALGLRVGLVDLATMNLINLCRGLVGAWGGESGDVALLNSAPTYFSLAILRDERLIFFRCKSYAAQEIENGSHGTLERELENSLAYYRDKLDGRGVHTLALRSVGRDERELCTQLGNLGVGQVLPIALSDFVKTNGSSLSSEQAQRVAPIVGAAMGRR